MKRVLILLLFSWFVWASAQDTEALAVGSLIEGETNNNPVTFEFKGVAGENVGFVVEADFTPVLTITDSDGRTLKTSRDFLFTNLPFVFTAPAEATYTLTIGTSFGNPSGAYTLEMTSETVTPIGYGENVETLPDPESIFAYFFNLDANEGDVVNIYATSEEDDLRLRMFLPDGTEVTMDDDNGPSTDPYIRRLIVPVTASYLISASPAFDRNVVEAPFTLYVEPTELLPITPEAMTIALGGEVTGDTDTELFVFDEAEPRTAYRLVIATQRADTQLTVEVTQGNERLARFTISDSLRTSVDFVARSGGRIFILIDDTRFRGDPIEYDVSLIGVE